MKKRLKRLTYPALFVLVFMVALHVKINTNKKQFSSIDLINIETLSYAETTSATCLGVGSLDCTSTNSKVKYLY